MYWQPIETAPRDGVTFLAWDGYAVLGAWYEIDCEYHYWAMDGDEIDAADVTHWMPLPEPPK